MSQDDFKKIYVYKNPLDKSKKIITRVLPHEKNLYQLLRRLNIHNIPLCVEINGVIKDDIDEKMPISCRDEISIYFVLNGSLFKQEEGSSLFGSILGFAGAIAGLAVGGWIGVVIAVGSGLISSQINKRNLQKNTGGSAMPPSPQETLGLESVKNNLTPNGPIPLPMGKIKFAPPLTAPPHMSSYGDKWESTTNAWPSFLFMQTDPSTWETIPAGSFMTSPYNWPSHDIKVAPIMPAIDIISQPVDWRAKLANYLDFAPWLPESKVPILIYHHDPSDPMYMLYSFLGLISMWDSAILGSDLPVTQADAIKEYKYAFGLEINRPSWWTATNETTGPWYSPSDPLPPAQGPSRIQWCIGSTHQYIRNLTEIFGTYSGIYSSLLPENYHYWPDFFMDQLNKYYLDTPLGVIPPVPVIPTYQSVIEQIYSQPKVLDLNQIFNNGFGDFEPQEKRVGDISLSDISHASTLDVYKPAAQIPFVAPNPDGGPNFSLGVKTLDSCELTNDGSGPSGPVNPTDQSVYNWTYRKAPKGTKVIYVDIEGQLYQIDPEDETGVWLNKCTFEIQFKSEFDVDFQASFYMHISSYKVDVVRRVFPFSILDSTPATIFRIRKVDLDDQNNQNPFVCKFTGNFRADTSGYPDPSDMRAQNVTALYLQARTNSLASSNEYTNLVETKMWYYDYFDDEWKYGFSNNPAFVFLYFARGGFLNMTSDGSDPASPTIMWSNGPEHDGVSEILFGCGLKDSKIDIEEIKEWGRFCEQESFTFNYVLANDLVCSDVLDMIAASGSGIVDTFRGKLSVKWIDKNQTFVGMFGMSNIIEGSFSVSYNANPIPENVKVLFSNEDLDFKQDEIEVEVPSNYEKEMRTEDVTLTGVTSPAVALKFARRIAAQIVLNNKYYSWQTDNEGRICDMYDLVLLSHDATDYSYSGRVLNIKSDSSNDFESVTVTSILPSNISHVVLRMPDGTFLQKEVASVIDKKEIVFTTPLDKEFGPYELPDGSINADSNFYDSKILDYLIIAGFKETPGKVVRIVGIEETSEGVFDIQAIDEDPAVYEFEDTGLWPLDFNSNKDSAFTLSVEKFRYENRDGFTYMIWSGCSAIKIYDLDSEVYLVDSNGVDVFSNNRAKLNLAEGKHNLRLEPQGFGSAIINKEVSVWV